MNAALCSVAVTVLACAGAGTAATQDDVAAAMERYSKAAPQNVAAEAMAGRLTVGAQVAGIARRRAAFNTTPQTTPTLQRISKQRTCTDPHASATTAREPLSA